MKRKSLKQVIDEFIAVHGDRYDYSLVHYQGTGRKVMLRCRVHGIFEVTPHHHFKSRSGCRKCYDDSNRLTLKAFLSEAVRHFGNHYDYSMVTRFALSGDITLRCKVHETLVIQNARNHYRGHHGCKACLSSMLSGAADLRGTVRSKEELTTRFIEKARSLHGDNFDYSGFLYTAARTKGLIKCRQGHIFEQSPANHLKGHGCPTCSLVNKFSDSFKRSFGSATQYWRALKRRQAGLAPETVLKKGYVRNQRRVNPIWVGGVEYPNHAELYRTHTPKASTASVTRWIARGMDPELALEHKTSTDGRIGIIYLITNLQNGMRYVGLTVQPLSLRWQGHVEAAKRGDHTSPNGLHHAIRTYGERSFIIQRIDQGVMGRDLERKERHWIKELKCLAPGGMNLSPGGTSGGSRPNPITVDGVTFRSRRAAAVYVALTREVSEAAAKWRIRHGKIDLLRVCKS